MGNFRQRPVVRRFGRHRLRYADTGDGPPVLLMNGLDGTVELWDPVVERLTDAGFRTIAYDSPGVGNSSTPRRPLMTSSLARVATQLLDHLGCEAADVIGYSLGGHVAQQFAHDFPARTRHLVLAATNYGLGSQPPRPPVAACLVSPARFYSGWVYERTLPLLVGGKAASNPALVKEYLDNRMHRSFMLRSYLFQLVSGATFSSYRWLPSIEAPTLVVVGDDDPLIPVRNARLVAGRLPKGRLEIVHGAGHLFLVDDVDVVLPTVVEFLGSATSCSP